VVSETYKHLCRQESLDLLADVFHDWAGGPIRGLVIREYFEELHHTSSACFCQQGIDLRRITMGRGAQQQSLQMTKQQLDAQNSLNQQLYSRGESLQNSVSGGYQDLLANAGYSPTQQSAITNQSMGALASTFAALASSAANRVGRTRNSAGYGEMLDALAREKGQQTASLAQQAQIAFADRSKQDQLAGLQGLSGLYGVNSSLLSRALGIPADLLNINANVAKTPGFGSSFLNSLGTSLGRLL
jgi:hypothetical protein